MPLFGSKKRSEIPAPDSGPPSGPPSYRSNAPSVASNSSASNNYRPGYGSSQPPPARVNFGNRYANSAPPPPQQQQQQGGYGQGPPPQQGYGGYAQDPPQGRPGYGQAPPPPQGYPAQQPPPPAAQSSRSRLFGGGAQNSIPAASNSAYAGTIPQNDGGMGAGSYAAGGGVGAAYGGQSGYGGSAPAGGAYGGQNGGYGGGQQSQEADEDDEIEGIRHMVKQTNQQSLASTRNALRTAREAEETARATVEKLNEQTERFAATEQSLDIAKNYASRTEDNTKEIKALNRSIFRPNITFNKQGKRDAADARILERHLNEKEERDQMLRDADRARNIGDTALGRRPGYGPIVQENPGREGRRDYAQRAKYTFEADEEDHAVEDEIEDNLDEMTRLAQSLNGLATAQGNILGEHNKKLDGLNDKADALDIKLVKGTQKMKHL